MCVRLHVTWTYSIPPLQEQLQQAKEHVNEFQQSYQSLGTGVGSEVFKQQLEACKVRVTASSSNCFCPGFIPLSVPRFTPNEHVKALD